MLKVLIAEDDLMIADMVEEILLNNGYAVCGIARTVAEGIALGRDYLPDLAILDMRLADGGLGTEIAEELSGLGRIGILYASGNMSQIVLTAADGDACLAKPYRPSDLLQSLRIVSDIIASGSSNLAPPRGFQRLCAAPLTSLIPSDG